MRRGQRRGRGAGVASGPAWPPGCSSRPLLLCRSRSSRTAPLARPPRPPNRRAFPRASWRAAPPRGAGSAAATSRASSPATRTSARAAPRPRGTPAGPSASRGTRARAPQAVPASRERSASSPCPSATVGVRASEAGPSGPARLVDLLSLVRSPAEGGRTQACKNLRRSREVVRRDATKSRFSWGVSPGSAATRCTGIWLSKRTTRAPRGVRGESPGGSSSLSPSPRRR
jgi:hypothetical protein